MWKKGCFKAVRKNNPRTHSLQQNKKAVLTTAAFFEGTIIAFRLPLFTKKDVSRPKQKK